MQIKIPVGLDTSRYELIPDFSLVFPRPAIVITKATEGIGYTDPTFSAYFIDLKSAGIPRGCYHFFRKLYSATTQAQHFCSVIRPYVTDKDILVLDVEEGGETGAQLKEWFVYVESQFPFNQLMIYSRKNLLDAIPTFAGVLAKFAPKLADSYAAPPHPLNSVKMTLAERDYFKHKVKVWTAGYPFNPDLYSSPPSFYIPDPNKWGEVWLWQYSDQGILQGIDGEVDVNWISPVLLNILGENPTLPPIPTPTNPYPGVELYKFQKNGVNVYVEIVDMKNKRAKVVYDPNLKTVEQFTKDGGAQIGINGHAWDTRLPAPHLPQGLCVSDGNVIINEKTGAPFINIAKDNQLSMRTNDYRDLYNAISGFRYLVEDGEKKSYLDGTTPEYTQLHARSGKGILPDGRLILAGSEGYTLTAGLTLSMFADVFMMFGTQVAMDNDEGSSFALENRLIGGTNKPVVTALLIYTEGASMIDIVSTKYNMTLRSEHSTGVLGLESVPANTHMIADVIWTATADLYKIINGVNTKINSIGDKWGHVTSVNGVNKDAWVAIIHNYTVYCTYTDTSLPPPADLVQSFDLHVDNVTHRASFTALHQSGVSEVHNYEIP
jgi:GH25 family lysozyme M1 (1,4-beta-N-acetylmuramidase)